MNQDWKEKQIRELFNELGDEDERLAPCFASVLESALVHRNRSRRTLVWRLAAAAVVPILALVGLVVLRNQSAEPPVQIGTTPTLDLHPLDLQRQTTIPGPIGVPPTGTVGAPKPRQRKSDRQASLKSIQISRWQSPTDFLLETPGSEILRNLPRMPDSPPGIPRSLPDYHN